MANPYFQFKQFTIQQDHCAMKVTTDACLFGAWISKEIQHQNPKVSKVLDIGAGTGLLSLMMAQKNNSSMIDTIEMHKASFQQAKENIDASPFADRINIFYGDVKDFAFTEKYDCIISNPPFYENDLRSSDISKNVAHHNEGLTLSELLSIIKTNLDYNGIFYLLLPYKRSNEIKGLMLKHEFSITQMILVRQSVNYDYFRIILSGKLKTEELVETIIDEISIWNEKQEYTPGFIELLKDYYLYL